MPKISAREGAVGKVNALKKLILIYEQKGSDIIG
jgi:hypothetical protein